MDDWQKFHELSLPAKEDFYSHLNMEDITDADYMHAKRVCKYFKIKNSWEYYDLYFQDGTLLLAGVFEDFKYMCLKIYKLAPVKYLSAPGLAWQDIGEGIYLSIYRYGKANGVMA